VVPCEGIKEAGISIKKADDFDQEVALEKCWTSPSEIDSHLLASCLKKISRGKNGYSPDNRQVVKR